MLDNYLTRDEFLKKYSPYQKGQTVTIIKPIYRHYGKYEVGTEFVIEKVGLRYDIGLPKVLSSKADDFYADGRMFLYDMSNKDHNGIITVDIEYFEKNKFGKKDFLVIITLFSIVIAFIIGFFIGFTRYVMSCDNGICALCCFVGTLISTSLLGIFLEFNEPKLHKKRK